MRRLIVWVLAILLSACGDRPRFPEDQTIQGPVEIASEWRTMEFKPPLAIAWGEGLQELHFVVDNSSYRVIDVDEVPEKLYASLRRLDGAEVLPEVVLIASTGAELPVVAVSNIGLWSGGLTIGFGLSDGVWEPPPPFPADVTSIRSVKFRSDVPLVAERLMWMVRHHPDIHRCGHKCSWWEQWFR